MRAPDCYEIQKILASQIACVSLDRHDGSDRLSPSSRCTPGVWRSFADTPGREIGDGTWPLQGSQSLERAIPFSGFRPRLADVDRAYFNAVLAGSSNPHTVRPVDDGTLDAVRLVRVRYAHAIRL